MDAVLIRGAEIWQHGIADLRLAEGRIAAIGGLDPLPGEPVIEARGGALLPGLHDHHIHLNALAARRSSVLCGPPAVRDAEDLARALKAAPGEGWIRGIGYHDSIMGLPDAAALDRLVRDRPLRVQHRSGRMWLLNTMALGHLLALAEPPPGMERDGAQFTGRLFDADAWLRANLAGSPPGLADLSRELAASGVTGVTDMSPGNDAEAAGHFAHQIGSGDLLQGCTLAGTLALAAAPQRGWSLGPAKLHLHEAALPDFDEAAQFIAAAHAQGRGVAVHCVSEVELVFAVALLEAAGTRHGDRIEHASIAPDALAERMAALGVIVCVQPHFIAERGDRYLADVEPEHHPALYRLAGLQSLGIPLCGGSDAPFGSADPWAAMAAAVSRRTAAEQVIGAAEALTPEQALALYLADPADPGRIRTLDPGAQADVCLLDEPWTAVRTDLSARHVRATIIAGRLVHDRVDQPPVQRLPRAQPLAR